MKIGNETSICCPKKYKFILTYIKRYEDMNKNTKRILSSQLISTDIYVCPHVWHHTSIQAARVSTLDESTTEDCPHMLSLC